MIKTDNELPIVDWEQEAQLAHKSNGLINELLVMFAEQMPATQQALNQAFAKKNYQELSDLLHKLQGGCVYCGLTRLKAVIAKVTRSIRDTQQVPQTLIDQINQEMDAVMQELRRKGIIS